MDKMRKYFVVKDPCSGKETLYQVVHGTPEQGFEIVAAGHNIGALADSLISYAETKGGISIDVYITPPLDDYWVDMKDESDSVGEVEDDVEIHATKKVERRHLNKLMARLHERTKDKDFMFMFYR